MILIYQNGAKQFFTRKQYRRHNALYANYFAQSKRVIAAIGGPVDALVRAARSEKSAFEAWSKEREAAFVRGKRFCRRRKSARS
jgi:hypothetical protein